MKRVKKYRPAEDLLFFFAEVPFRRKLRGKIGRDKIKDFHKS